MSRLKEFVCVIFGHDWTEEGSKRHGESGIILDQYKKCGRCKLEAHDRSGYLLQYELDFVRKRIVHSNDIIQKEEEVVVWANVHQSGKTFCYETRELADSYASKARIARVKIKCKLGQFDE